MKSNRKFIFGACALIASLAIAWFFFSQNEKEGSSATTNVKPDSGGAKSKPQMPPSKQDNPSTREVNAPKIEALRKFFNAPIDFFGKVVDETGKPIAGAQVFYIVANASFSGSPTLQGPQSDQDGRFSILGKNGPRLSVQVQHSNYYPTQSADQQIIYAKSENYAAGKEPSSPPTGDSPAIFVLKKKGTPEALIHFRRIRASLPMNGTPVTVNLRTGRAGGGSEAITFILKSEADKLPMNAFHPFNWSVTIQVPSGGLVERADALNFEAPPGKYPSEIVSENDPSKLKEDWSSVTQKDYFLSFGSGVYGRVRVEVSGEKGRVIAESFLNPTPGSRNLEFDPSKVVSSP